MVASHQYKKQYTPLFISWGETQGGELLCTGLQMQCSLYKIIIKIPPNGAVTAKTVNVDCFPPHRVVMHQNTFSSKNKNKKLKKIPLAFTTSLASVAFKTSFSYHHHQQLSSSCLEGLLNTYWVISMESVSLVRKNKTPRWLHHNW